MSKIFAAVVLAVSLMANVVHTEPQIHRLDPRLDPLLPADARLEPVVSGHSWVEGPVWFEDGLLYSDIPRNAVYRWEAGTGDQLWLEKSGYSGEAPFTGREPGSNGLALDREGRVLLCQHGNRRIVRRERDGSFTVLADRYQGKRLNSPNDVVALRNGDLYFTDPPFGLPGVFDDPGKELSWSGVYRLRPDGELTLLISDLSHPNGIAFSSDEKTLYISNADRGNALWLAYEVKPDGTLGTRRVLAEGTEWAKTRPGGPDGLKVDREGNLWAAGPGGVYIFAPDGKLLGFLELGHPTGNLAWGEDGSTLFIAGDSSVYRLRTATKGARW